MQFKKNGNANFGITEVMDNVKKRFRKEPERVTKLKTQKALEEVADKTNIKNLKSVSANKVPATLAAYGGNPERRVLKAGKASDSAIVKTAADALEGFGKLGYLEGATGNRNLLNKVVGRTASGKVARTLGLLGTVGVGKAALRKRKEERF